MKQLKTLGRNAAFAGIVAMFAIACGVERNEHRRRPWCSGAEERAELQACIITLTEAGNPKSDEEGEDLVAQAEATCRRSSCPERWVTCRYSREGHEQECWFQ